METLIEIFSSIRILDIIDILIVSFVFYKLFVLIKDTRAEQLIKGLLFILVVSKLSDIAKLYAIYFILDNAMKLGFIALIIVFQPELRRALEYIGRNKFFQKDYGEGNTLGIRRSFDEIIEASKYLSSKKIGALIVLEKYTGLNNYIETGIKINADISSELLITIFYENTPLHDGALIIKNNTIVAANTYLPLSTSKDVSQDLGTRHRAAIGLSEVSDAIIIIVSEETGGISLVYEGKINRYLNSKKLSDLLVEKFEVVENRNRKFLNIFKLR